MESPVDDDDLLWSAEIRLTVSVPRGWSEADEEDLTERLERLVPEIEVVVKRALPETVRVAAAIV
jgi:hypothetical protein